MSMQSQAEEMVLDSWKEIATFLRRGVRTVQRWERTEGLPVRRQQHIKKGTVYALRSELARWRTSGIPGGDEIVRQAPEMIPSFSLIDAERLRQLCVVARRQAEMTRNRVIKAN